MTNLIFVPLARHDMRRPVAFGSVGVASSGDTEHRGANEYLTRPAEYTA
jgi:hypothetical protein